VRLRIPGWTGSARISVNGRPHPTACLPGTFAAIERDWQAGDRLELALSLPIRLASVAAQHPDRVAVIAGPLVLMRILGADPEPVVPLSRAALLSAEPSPGEERTWRVTAAGAPLLFRPFMDIHEESYRLYQSVTE
jgi:DUF1680 family protein